jgi:hypothetical protein
MRSKTIDPGDPNVVDNMGKIIWLTLLTLVTMETLEI